LRFYRILPLLISISVAAAELAYSRPEGSESNAFMRTLDRLPSGPRRSSARH
jgi:hypothetical protein